MIKICYKSDFDFILKIKDCRGEVLGWPDFDWTARLWTSQRVNAFVASCKGGNAVNCFNDNGQIHIVADTGHGLGAGRLMVEFTAEMPNEIYPDGFERVVNIIALDIELTRDAASCPENAEVEVFLPLIKGEPGEQGPEGQQGPQGPQGPDGASAYEQAVEGGYKGTEEEFEKALAEVSDKQNRLIDSEDVTVNIDKLHITENAKRQVFIDMWNDACGEYGTYNPDTGFFELNEITDITYEQAIAIMNAGKPSYDGNHSRYFKTKIRTHLPLLHEGYSHYATGIKMFAWSSIEAVNGINIYPGSYFFEVNPGLHTIIGPLLCTTASPVNCFTNCDSLRKIQMVIGSGLIVLKGSPLIDLESWNYIIEHKQNPATNISTIQVHPNVYAKLTGDTSKAAAAALTAEELAQWMALVETASSKNISFTV